MTGDSESVHNMSDETNQKQEGDVGEDQGETRNDVVVKIGLVGDAQVNCLSRYKLLPSVTHQAFLSQC